MTEESKASEFEHHARQKRQSFVSEFLHFLGENKKWWMLPMLVVLLLLGLVLIVGGSGVAPFIYTLF